MDNKFTTVISYEKPGQHESRVGSVILAGDVGALLKAIGFMLLWALFTAALLIDPLMSNSNAASGKSATQEQVNFISGAAPVTAPITTPITAPAATVATKQGATAQPAAARLAPPTGLLRPNLNEQALVEPAEARLRYALLMVK